MKKLLALLLAMMMTFSMAACGGSDDSAAEDTSADTTVTEEATVEEEAAELEFVDISDALAGTIWVDDGFTVYGFDTDCVTLYATLEDGTELTGEYLLETDSATGDTYLSMYINEVDTQVSAMVTEFADDYIAFIDIDTGVESILIPVDADAIMEEEVVEEATVEVVDISSELFDTYWIDDDATEYYFYSDNTMELMLSDGTYAVGEYLFECVLPDEVYYMSFSVPDFGVVSTNEVTAMDETGMIFIDIDTGVQTTMAILA